jgi:hypothetical protein
LPREIRQGGVSPLQSKEAPLWAPLCFSPIFGFLVLLLNFWKARRPSCPAAHTQIEFTKKFYINYGKTSTPHVCKLFFIQGEICATLAFRGFRLLAP